MEHGDASSVVVIRAWYDQGRFRARAIMAAGEEPDDGTVTVTDSVEELCGFLHDFFDEQQRRRSSG